MQCHVSQKANLFAITAAPFANQQVQPQTKPFRGTELCVECVGLQLRGLTTRKEKRTKDLFHASIVISSIRLVVSNCKSLQIIPHRFSSACRTNSFPGTASTPSARGVTSPRDYFPRCSG